MKSDFKDFKKFVENQQNKQNSIGIDDFDGLSPDTMHNLLYSSFTDKGLVQLNKNISTETINKIPIFKLVKHFMQILEREKQIKLTKAEYLPPKFVKELYEKTELKDDGIETGIIKLVSEIDAAIIFESRTISQMCGFSKVRKNEVSLTKIGELLLKDDRKLYFQLMEVFINKFNWGMISYYQDDGFIQRSIGYTLYLLDKYGNEYREEKFYYDKFIKAFPTSINVFEYDRNPDFKAGFHEGAYLNRVFRTFLKYIGAIEQKTTINKQEHTSINEARKTKLFDEIFTINIKKEQK
jgi:hypothetical protein